MNVWVMGLMEVEEARGGRSHHAEERRVMATGEEREREPGSEKVSVKSCLGGQDQAGCSGNSHVVGRGAGWDLAEVRKA